MSVRRKNLRRTFFVLEITKDLLYYKNILVNLRQKRHENVPILMPLAGMCKL